MEKITPQDSKLLELTNSNLATPHYQRLFALYILIGVVLSGYGVSFFLDSHLFRSSLEQGIFFISRGVFFLIFAAIIRIFLVRVYLSQQELKEKFQPIFEATKQVNQTQADNDNKSSLISKVDLEK